SGALAAAAGRTRLRATWATGDDAVGRRSAAHQDRARAGVGGKEIREEDVRDGRADDGPPPRGYSEAGKSFRPASRARPYYRFDRAQPRCDQARRLAHRSRA